LISLPIPSGDRLPVFRDPDMTHLFNGAFHHRQALLACAWSSLH
jgi:hypothetical protein